MRTSKVSKKNLKEIARRTSKVILIPIQELQHLARRALNWWSRLPLESNGPSLTITSAFSAQHVANASRNTRQIEQEMQANTARNVHKYIRQEMLTNTRTITHLNEKLYLFKFTYFMYYRCNIQYASGMRCIVRENKFPHRA